MQRRNRAADCCCSSCASAPEDWVGTASLASCASAVNQTVDARSPRIGAEQATKPVIRNISANSSWFQWIVAASNAALSCRLPVSSCLWAIPGYWTKYSSPPLAGQRSGLRLAVEPSLMMGKVSKWRAPTRAAFQQWCSPPAPSPAQWWGRWNQ